MGFETKPFVREGFPVPKPFVRDGNPSPTNGYAAVSSIFKKTVAGGGIVHQHMGHSPYELLILNDGAS